jgi:precorrin-6A/cobalt-precorrin-6A reductase
MSKNIPAKSKIDMRVLILGGTGDATELTTRLVNISGVEVIASLAGRTREPTAPVGNVRIGGFGGVEGLIHYLQEMQIDVLIDATHPFANQISCNAAQAATTAGVRHLILNRPPWEKVDNDIWLEVANNHAAAKILETQGNRVFLTVGRQEIAAFAHLKNIWFLMRMIDPPSPDSIVPNGIFLYNRGPFTLDDERKILIQHQIDTIVSKNSGGAATYPKIIAARELGIKVIMVQRPPVPPGEQVADVESAVVWLIEQLK